MKTIFQEYVDANHKNYAWLAKELGISYSAAQKWCTGKSSPSLHKVRVVASKMGISPVTLFTEIINYRD